MTETNIRILGLKFARDEITIDELERAMRKASTELAEILIENLNQKSSNKKINSIQRTKIEPKQIKK